MLKSLSIVFALLFAGAAHARTEVPLLVKSSGSGFMAPEWARSESCRLFSDRVEISKTYSGVTVVETRALAISDSLTTVIAKAKAETVESKDNFLCDGPGTGVYANIVGADDTSEEVLLFSTGGCGSPRQERTGPASHGLRDLIDGYCPTTYDFASH